jgi:predicted DCC family thiol-disulfide oxidoreductase YuxK
VFVPEATAKRGTPEDFAGNHAWMAALCNQMLHRVPAPAPESGKTGRGHPLIVFDGCCGLCNGLVDFLIARDPKAVFRFAPLQGETAIARIPNDAVPYDPVGDPRSIVLWDRGTVFRKSDAVLRALPLLGGVWRLAALLRAIPRPLRDIVYDFVARHRYRWFGRREACRVPGPGERNRFFP